MQNTAIPRRSNLFTALNKLQYTPQRATRPTSNLAYPRPLLWTFKLDSSQCPTIAQRTTLFQFQPSTSSTLISTSSAGISAVRRFTATPNRAMPGEVEEIKPLAKEEYRKLYTYNACEISDALLKLKVPGAGFLADISMRSPGPDTDPLPTIIAPAHTVLFISKSSSSPDTANIPSTSHYADLTPPTSSIVVISQPAGQRNAVLGGLVAARIKKLGAAGVVVDGRIRDLQEIQVGLEEFPVFSKGTSTVGAGAESKAVQVGGEIEIEGCKVRQNDIIVADGLNGVICIPREKLAAVLELLPKLVEADMLVMEDVVEGKVTLQESMKERRKGL